MARTFSADHLEEYFDPLHMTLLRLVKTEAERLGLPLYIVGGSVRDLLLGRVIHDFDLTVEGDAAQLAESVLRKYAGKVVFHSRFGTATWRLDETTFKRLSIPLLRNSSSQPFLDFISARSETYAQPGALPTVKRSTIDDDLQRRDFTVNAMALRLDGRYYGQLYDPLGGQADLERGQIRVLHNRSFVDDPTRMIRAVRYAVRYGFEIEPETLSVMNEEAKSVLGRLSGERLRHELDLIFEEQNYSAMLHQLGELDLLKLIHPSLLMANPELSSLEAPTSEFGDFALPDILSFKQTLGWTLWLLSLPVVAIDTLAARLSFPVPLVRSARSASVLRTGLLTSRDWKPSQWTFYLDEMPRLAIYAVYQMTHEPALREYLIHWQNIRPMVTGNDLKDRGLEPGPKYAQILRQLRTAWLDGDVKNKMEEKLLLDKLSQ